jgi:hypothetical protein
MISKLFLSSIVLICFKDRSNPANDPRQFTTPLCTFALAYRGLAKTREARERLSTSSPTFQRRTIIFHRQAHNKMYVMIILFIASLLKVEFFRPFCLQNPFIAILLHKVEVSFIRGNESEISFSIQRALVDCIMFSREEVGLNWPLGVRSCNVVIQLSMALQLTINGRLTQLVQVS